jgi:hypothetical protein
MKREQTTEPNVEAAVVESKRKAKVAKVARLKLEREVSAGLKKIEVMKTVKKNVDEGKYDV